MFGYRGVLSVPYSGMIQEAGKEKRVSDRAIRRRGGRGTSGKTRAEWMEVAEEIEAPTLVRRFLPNKETELVGTTRKEWVRGTPLKMQLGGGSDEVGKAAPYPSNREVRRGGSSKLCQD